MHLKDCTRSYWSWLFASRKSRAKSIQDENAARVNAALEEVAAAITAAAEDRRPDRRH